MSFRVGTRGSKLSLVQTDLVIGQLTRIDPGLQIEKRVISTKGDVDQHTPLLNLNQKGIFEKEIDQAVLEGKVDFAVHSMKDIPVFEQDSELIIAATPERASPHDVLVSKGHKTLGQLSTGSSVGTSSLLRASQLRRIRPDLRVESIRGNVETRVLKVEQGAYQAAILAEAGLARLGMSEKIAERLSLEDFMPAPGQGTLAIVTQRDKEKVVELLRRIDHPPTRSEAEAERELVRLLEGGCKVPVGGLATARGNELQLAAGILSVDGKERLRAARTGTVDHPFEIAGYVAEELLDQGAKRLEEGWRQAYQ